LKNRPIGENSPNLVTLAMARVRLLFCRQPLKFFFVKAEKAVPLQRFAGLLPPACIRSHSSLCRCRPIFFTFFAFLFENGLLEIC
jgi:hypothetical protein